MRLMSTSNYLFEALTCHEVTFARLKDCIRHRVGRGGLHMKVQVTFVQHKKKR